MQSRAIKKSQYDMFKSLQNWGIDKRKLKKEFRKLKVNYEQL